MSGLPLHRLSETNGCKEIVIIKHGRIGIDKNSVYIYIRLYRRRRLIIIAGAVEYISSVITMIFQMSIHKKYLCRCRKSENPIIQSNRENDFQVGRFHPAAQIRTVF